jgi:hypothetical protein
VTVYLKEFEEDCVLKIKTENVKYRTVSKTNHNRFLAFEKRSMYVCIHTLTELTISSRRFPGIINCLFAQWRENYDVNFPRCEGGDTKIEKMLRK